jgi:hypothetical protein
MRTIRLQLTLHLLCDRERATSISSAVALAQMLAPFQPTIQCNCLEWLGSPSFQAGTANHPDPSSKRDDVHDDRIRQGH